MAKFIGTPGNDLITGTEGSDFIISLQGDDVISGLGGNDRISANDGNDQVSGGEGNDRIRGGRGNDSIFTGGGNNIALGGQGDDFFSFSPGNDVMFGGGGDDTLTGGPGHDIIAGNRGSDTFLFDSDQPFKTDDFGTNSIVDFESNIDKITLSNITFNVLTPTSGPIDSDEFEVVAIDADASISEAFITYSTSTGNLFYNENGANPGLGDGGQFATLEGIPNLNTTDFISIDFDNP